MKKLYFITSLFLSTSFSLLCNGQPYQFDRISIENGLSQNTVNSILKDSEGFLWFGTNDGLNKFDGYRFTIYRSDLADSNSIINNKIYTLFEDHQKKIWIGTKEGLSVLDQETGSIRNYIHNSEEPGSITNNFIKAIFEDKDKNLFIGTLGGGLLKYSAASNKFKPVFRAGQTNLQIDNITSITQDASGLIWFASSNEGGIFSFDPKNPNESLSFFSMQSSESNSLLTFGKTLYFDDENKLWVCTEGSGLFRFDLPSKQFSPVAGLNNNIIKDITSDGSGNMWIATDGGGINLWNKYDGSITYIKNRVDEKGSVSSNAIYSLEKDPEQQIIWVGTFGGGISQYNFNKKQFYNLHQSISREGGINNRRVLAFEEDLEGQVWMGTDGDGLFLYEKSNESFKSFEKGENGLTSNVITALCMDSNERLWIGTYTGGLNYLDKESGNFKAYLHNPQDTNSISSNNVWDIVEDSKGRIWLATLYNGLDQFDPQTGKFIHWSKILKSRTPGMSRVTNLMEDNKGNIWMGGEGLGILNPDTKSFTKICHNPKNASSLSNNEVRKIFQDSKGRIWVGTEGGGLNLFHENRTFTRFTTNQGLANNSVHAIEEDKQGNLWISTNNGISKFNPEEESFQNYDVHDGLESNEFSYAASHKNREGKLYFGSISGATMFFPDSIKMNKYIPPVSFTDFKIFNRSVIPGESSALKKSIGKTKEITLKHDNSVITFEFTALNYVSSEKNLYAYKMEGFDKDWNRVGTKKTATYTNLNPGTYNFKVIASNNDGLWNEKGESIQLTILPPWWKTNWAYTGFILAFLLILYSYRTHSIRWAQLKQNLKLQEMERQKIEEINQLKLSFFTNISHEFKTPLTLILGPLETLLNSSHVQANVASHLRLMQKNANRLMRLINELIDFRKIETKKMHLHLSKIDVIPFVRDILLAFNDLAESHHIKYRFSSNVDSLTTLFDLEKLDKIIYNLISNAFKFTPEGGEISVRVNKKTVIINGALEEWLEIEVKDTGIGIPEKQIHHIFDRFFHTSYFNGKKRSICDEGSGIGLSLTKELVTLHYGTLMVQSDVGKGSTFTVNLPMAEKYYQNESPENLNSYESSYQVLPQRPIVFANPVTLEGSAISREDSHPYQVLLVEDNEEVRDFISSYLSTDYCIIEAENGKVGIEKAMEHIPDLIISDIMMPETDGLALCQKLKSNYKTSHIPIILLTAKGNLDSKIEGYTFGADDYVEKPFNPKLLKIRVDNLIGSRISLREQFKRDFLMQPREVEVVSPEDKFIKDAISIIEKNMSNSEFDVKHFVREMGLSRSVLYRKLKAVTDQSANEFINLIRLKRAAQLLQSSAFTISQVSYEVGFNDPQYFSKCFKKQYGIRPSDYASEINSEITQEAKT